MPLVAALAFGLFAASTTLLSAHAAPWIGRFSQTVGLRPAIGAWLGLCLVFLAALPFWWALKQRRLEVRRGMLGQSLQSGLAALALWNGSIVGGSLAVGKGGPAATMRRGYSLLASAWTNTAPARDGAPASPRGDARTPRWTEPFTLPEKRRK